MPLSLLLSALPLLLPPQDELVILHARVPYGLTCEAAEPDQARVFEGALVLRDGKIAALHAGEFKKESYPGARVIDAQGRVVLPGFLDAHTHFLEGSLGLLRPNLMHTQSSEELCRRLAAAAAALPPGTWITGTGWDHEAWPGAALPTAAELDRFVPDHPVFVTRTDMHMALCNSAALRLARIDETTPDPAGGMIVRVASTRAPAGVLKDEAMSLVAMRIPPEPEERRREALLIGQAHAFELGITGVCDMGLPADWKLYCNARRAGELQLRIAFFAPLDRIDEVDGGATSDPDALQLCGIKTFVDGSLGSTTAWFDEGYSDQPTFAGLPMAGVEATGGPLAERIAAARRQHHALAVHAIGDRANAWILDRYASWVGDEGPRVLMRVEHAQHLRSADIARFAKLDVIASMQPYHVADDGRWALSRIGMERARRTYAFRSLLDQGATVAFGSDWPVAPLSPWLGVAAAVTRATTDGKHSEGWVPEQKITRGEAIRAYTVPTSKATLSKLPRGRLAVGYAADLIVLERDPEAVPDAELAELRVDVTIVGGCVVYERSTKDR